MKFKKQILGKARVSSFILCTSPSIIITIFTCYFIVIYQKVESPYPLLSITSTAIHYPSSQIFRFGMGCNAACFFILYHAIFSWLRMTAKKFKYKGCIYQGMYWPTMISVIGYFFTISTADSLGTTSTWYQKCLHNGGAYIFIIHLGLLMFNAVIVIIKIWMKSP